MKLQRTDGVEELMLKYPNAFVILSIASLRARRDDDAPNPHNLKIGQAVIGRSEFTQGRAAMSDKNFRTALRVLREGELMASQGTSRGTIVTILNERIYDINSGEGGQPKGQKGANEGATNKKSKEDKNNPPIVPPEIPEWRKDFSVYREECLAALNVLRKDKDWVERMRNSHPEINFKATMQKSIAYWSNESGWEKKKKSKTKKINWKETFAKSLSLSFNQIPSENGNGQSEAADIKLISPESVLRGPDASDN